MRHVVRVLTVAIVLAVALGSGRGGALAAARDARPAPPKEIQDKVMGEYVGTFTAADGKKATGIAKVVAQFKKGRTPDREYRAYLTAVTSGVVEKCVVGKDAKVLLNADLRGRPGEGGKVTLSGRSWKGTIADGKLSAAAAGSRGGRFDLAAVVRRSPTELAKPPAGAVVLLPYAKDTPPSLEAWTNKKWTALPDGSVVVRGGTSRTKRQFTDFKLHLEFRIPLQSRGSGNSGVYILDRYEIQVLNSFGRKVYKGGCAAVYQTFPPAANACLAPERWQTYDITFRAARMTGKEITKLPRVTVVHNGVTVHEDVEVPHATGNARQRGHAPRGPIQLQDHGSPVGYRNIWLVEMAK